MTPSVLTPAGIFDDPTSVSVPTQSEGLHVSYARYRKRSDASVYNIRLPRPAPPNLRVSIELGREDEGIWARVPELNVAADGADIDETLRNLLGAVRDWLIYLREEQPSLAADLASQARYVALLDAPVFSWFKSARFAG